MQNHGNNPKSWHVQLLAYSTTAAVPMHTMVMCVCSQTWPTGPSHTACRWSSDRRSADERPCHCILTPVRRAAAEQSLKVSVLNVRSLGNKSNGHRARRHRRPHAQLFHHCCKLAQLRRVPSPPHCHDVTLSNMLDREPLQPRRPAWNSQPTELKLLQSITTSRFRLKTFPLDLPTDTGKQSDGCFVVHPWSPSRMRNINHCYSYSYTPKTTVLTVIRIPWFSCSLIINDEHRNSTEKQHNTTLPSISKTQPGRFPSSSHCAAVLSFAFSMRFTMMTNFVALHNNKTAILYQTTRKRKPIQILVGTKIKWLAVKKCVNNLSEVPVLGLPFPCTIATRNENSSVLLQTMGKSSSRYIMW